jgi:hypothetical protein
MLKNQKKFPEKIFRFTKNRKIQNYGCERKGDIYI